MPNNIPYTWLDRLIHKTAFNNSILKNLLPDLESGLFSNEWKKYSVNRPIFITSLPRAGTTIILESLSKLPGMSAHTYRDMPFVLTPVLWKKLAGNFYSRSQQKQRAHGDGLLVNEDSPEAFEEVLWMKFFNSKYTEDRINLCDNSDINQEFNQFFCEHIKKILSIRSEPERPGLRYISKNNGNIAHIEYIQKVFPDAFIIVPLRQPVEHAISMWRQHKNFLKQHAENRFTYEYMKDIGHFEFGELHKPIAFHGLDDMLKNYKPITIDYWLNYWLIAFKYLFSQQSIKFISYENICSNGTSGLNKLSNHLGLEVSDETIERAASIFHAPPPPRNNEYEISKNLINEAEDLYQQVLIRSL